MYTVSYLSGMIYKNGAHSRVCTAKVNKSLPWQLFCLLILPLSLWGQAPAEPQALWDSVQHRVVFVQGADSLFSIPLNKSFSAGLNHEKKKKKKTIRYRLARYSAPVEVYPVPVGVGGSGLLLCLSGKLQGDTVADFGLTIRVENGMPVVEMKVPAISVNEFSFEVKCLQNLCNFTFESPAPDTRLRIKKKKRAFRVSTYGYLYCIRIAGQ